MNSISYNFYDTYTVRIDGLHGRALPDLNCKYLWFKENRIDSPDLTVEIGPFKPDSSGASLIDQRYMIRKNYLYWSDSVKGLRFCAEIQGLEQDHSHIRFHMSPLNRLHFPWTLFPDLILHFYVLQPFIECKLAERGIHLLHSAGCVTGGKSVLVAGRGGSAKTGFTMGMLRQGFELLGDDMVALSGDRFKPHPTHTNWLAFLLSRCSSEEMGLPDMVKLFFYLRQRKNAADLKYADPALPGSINLVYRAAVIEAVQSIVPSDRETVNALRSNHEMERLTYVSYKYNTWRFLESYGYLFPDCFIPHFWEGWTSHVLRLTRNCHSQRLLIPFKWHEKYVSMLV